MTSREVTLLAIKEKKTKKKKSDLLTDAGVAGEDVGVLHHGQVGGGVLGDLQHAAPLGKLRPRLLVLRAPLRQAVQACPHTDIKIIIIIMKHL